MSWSFDKPAWPSTRKHETLKVSSSFNKFVRPSTRKHPTFLLDVFTPMDCNKCHTCFLSASQFLLCIWCTVAVSEGACSCLVTFVNPTLCTTFPSIMYYQPACDPMFLNWGRSPSLNCLILRVFSLPMSFPASSAFVRASCGSADTLVWNCGWQLICVQFKMDNVKQWSQWTYRNVTMLSCKNLYNS